MVVTVVAVVAICSNNTYFTAIKHVYNALKLYNIVIVTVFGEKKKKSGPFSILVKNAILPIICRIRDRTSEAGSNSPGFYNDCVRQFM